MDPQEAMTAYRQQFGAGPEVPYEQLPFTQWGDLMMNYSGAGLYSGPVLNAFAPKFATRGEAKSWLEQFYAADDGFQDPLWDYRLAQRIAGATGAANDPGWQQWFAQAEQDAAQRTAIEHARNRTGMENLVDVLKGAAFVAGAMSGFGALGGESFAGAMGIGGTASGPSGVTSAIGTAGDLISKAIGTAPGTKPSTAQLFELPPAAAEVVGADTLAPTARAVQKRRGSSSRAVAMRSSSRRVSGRASTILGDYLSEDYLG
jgi:hypothetical protein